MRISKLSIRQYRNYQEETFVFRPGLNVILGDNATGKTNVLEAIFFLTTVHSNRTHNHRELIQHACQGMSLEGDFEGAARYTITIKMYATGRKDIRMEGKRCLKITDILGKVPVVWFSPEDLHLVKGEPEKRRRWINFVLTQVRPNYADTLKRYQRILIERNAALHRMQEGKLTEREITVWDEELADKGIILIQERDSFITALAPIAQRMHERLSGGTETLAITYQPSIDIRKTDNPRACVMQRLNERRSAELVMGTTLVGPHRDELDITLSGKSARSFASQGQQRSIVLSLKLAEITYIKKMLQMCPIGLFDDVLSELDNERSRQFWELLLHEKDMQCLLSSVNPPEYIRGIAEPHWISVPRNAGYPASSAGKQDT